MSCLDSWYLHANGGVHKAARATALLGGSVSEWGGRKPHSVSGWGGRKPHMGACEPPSDHWGSQGKSGWDTGARDGIQGTHPAVAVRLSRKPGLWGLGPPWSDQCCRGPMHGGSASHGETPRPLG